jgi:2-C-methyl-D-erythritol 2,4-cyclodiphosphate synthase
MSYRIGFGIDFHQLAEGRDLWIGGVKIPHHKGSLGHSDADVLLHAICDAMLGALALGDIGMHFPNNDPAYKNIDSKILLQKCFELISSKGYKIVNVDSSVCLEEPKRHCCYIKSINRRCFSKSNHHRKNGFCRKRRRTGSICKCVVGENKFIIR